MYQINSELQNFGRYNINGTILMYNRKNYGGLKLRM